MLYMQFPLKTWERWVVQDIFQKPGEGKAYKEDQEMMGCLAKITVSVANQEMQRTRPISFVSLLSVQ